MIMMIFYSGVCSADDATDDDSGETGWQAACDQKHSQWQKATPPLRGHLHMNDDICGDDYSDGI